MQGQPSLKLLLMWPSYRASVVSGPDIKDHA
jgi:hypothetical protein